MATCNRNNCDREAVDGYRACPVCREYTASAVRKCYAGKRERGECLRCSRPALIWYSFCHRHQIEAVLSNRKRRQFRCNGGLYVLKTHRCYKVGPTGDFKQRARQLPRELGCGIELVKWFPSMGHLEPFVHILLNAYRLC